MMDLQDYIDYYDIDMEATEAVDYLIEVINDDIGYALSEQDFEEAHRLQEIIETKLF